MKNTNSRFVARIKYPHWHRKTGVLVISGLYRTEKEFREAIEKDFRGYKIIGVILAGSIGT